MNLFQLVFKQMRQRALSTWLTLLSVVIGVALAVAIMILQRESAALFGQSDFGYDIIIGPPKGSPLQLVLNTVYHLDTSAGTVPYTLYQDMARHGKPPPGHADYGFFVKQAIPFMVGDSYNGKRLVGTSPQMFGYDDNGKRMETPFEYRKGKSYEFADGRVFDGRKFEAVIGSEVATTEHMGIGSKFRATHGFPGPNDKPDIHKPVWTVVGVLKPTHTANDRVLFIPFISLYAIAEHEVGILDQALMKMGVDPTKIPPDQVDAVLVKLGFDLNKVPASALKALKQEAKGTKVDTSKEGSELIKDLAAPPTTQVADEGEDPDVYHLDEKGHIIPDLPEEEWELSAILVKSRSAFGADQLLYRFKVISNEAIAVNPASVMRDFFDTFLKPSSMILLVVTFLVTIVAGISILVSIYNSISARMREIAILRALGATRARVLTIFCTEAAMIGLFGAILGLVVGHGIAAVGSVYFNRTIGQSIAWYTISGEELLAAVGAVAIAALAGLVPAMKAYRTPVAVNLVSG